MVGIGEGEVVMDEVGGSFDHGIAGHGGSGSQFGGFALEGPMSRAEAGRAFYRVAAVLHQVVSGKAPVAFLHSLVAFVPKEAIVELAGYMQTNRCRPSRVSGDDDMTCPILVNHGVALAARLSGGSLVEG